MGERAEGEYESLASNGTWFLVDPPMGANIIKSKCVLRVKRYPDGTVSRHTARLVDKECSWREGIDYSEAYAPVTWMASIRCLLSLAALDDLEISTTRRDVGRSMATSSGARALRMVARLRYLRCEKICRIPQCSGFRIGYPQWRIPVEAERTIASDGNLPMGGKF